MKRYIVYECESYYPAGGMDDAKWHTDSLETAKKWCEKEYSENNYATYEIYDSHTAEYHTLYSQGWGVISIELPEIPE